MSFPRPFLRPGGLVLALLLSAVCPEARSQQTLAMTKMKEPKEGAFTLLKPGGWLNEGGIVRWDPLTYGGPANCIEAKVDFTLKKDAKGSVQIHWIPEIYYVDMRGSLAGGMFPVGSWYNGMPVQYKMDAQTFLNRYLVQFHEKAGSLTLVETRNLPEVARLCADLDFMKEMQCTYTAAVSDFRFVDGGVAYRERAFCVIQDMGPYTAGMWRNRHTVSVRAPEAEFARWEPLFKEIIASVELDPGWIVRELRGQGERGGTMIRTQEEVNRIGREIARGQAETNARINHQSYLNLTGQEDYVNPHTGETETGTNQWDHRWVDNLGNVIYTDNEDYNPNIDVNLNMSGFKRSRVKQ
ncbi:MAG: hypothetical protein R2751_09125 [Bacteroidales bacterium]